MNNFGYYVIVDRSGLVVRPGTRGDAMNWVDIEVDTFDAALDALNADGWHVSWHETEAEARELAKAGVCCHGKWYYGRGEK